MRSPVTPPSGWLWWADLGDGVSFFYMYVVEGKFRILVWRAI